MKATEEAEGGRARSDLFKWGPVVQCYPRPATKTQFGPLGRHIRKVIATSFHSKPDYYVVRRSAAALCARHHTCKCVLLSYTESHEDRMRHLLLIQKILQN